MPAEVVPGTRMLPLWHVATASVRGSAHGNDIPNQDAVATASVDIDGPHRAHVAAVADGHGGSRYVRSDRGARLAVELAVDRLKAATATSPQARAEDILREELPILVEEWRRAVHADVRHHPFTPEERSRAGADLDTQPAVAYGTTLLVALISGGDVGLAQLGDGDLAVRLSDGRCLRPVPGDGRLVGGETTSLCLPTAGTDFRFASLDRDESVEIVLLATDGYGNSFAEEEWWPGVLNDISGFVDARGPHDLSERLPDWLSESALIGGDDVTVAVLARAGHITTPPLEEPAAEAIDEAPTLVVPLRVDAKDPGTLVIGRDDISLQPSSMQSAALLDSSARSRRTRMWVRGAAVIFLALAVILCVILVARRPAAHAPSEQRSRPVNAHTGLTVPVPVLGGTSPVPSQDPVRADPGPGLRGERLMTSVEPRRRP